MTDLLHLRLLPMLILLMAVEPVQAQADRKKHQCELLKEGQASSPIRMAHKMPEFPGGEEKMKKFIKANFKHSKQQKQGTVFIAVVIDTSGTITGERVLKGINGEYNREALRVIRMMPRWDPGECEAGNKVAVEVLIKINV